MFLCLHGFLFLLLSNRLPYTKSLLLTTRLLTSFSTYLLDTSFICRSLLHFICKSHHAYAHRKLLLQYPLLCSKFYKLVHSLTILPWFHVHTPSYLHTKIQLLWLMLTHTTFSMNSFILAGYFVVLLRCYRLNLTN